jgi:hypothetical protein
MSDDELREVIRPYTTDVWWLEYCDKKDGGISTPEVEASYRAEVELDKLAAAHGLERVLALHQQMYAEFDANPNLVPHVVIPDSALNGMGGLVDDLRRRRAAGWN